MPALSGRPINHMEAASLPESQPVVREPRRPLKEVLWENILWVMLGAALLYYFADDQTQTLRDVKTGLSNGTIWALIALGYTLVYGIIELINFAHGEVFMIGSFVTASLFVTLGLTEDTAIIALIFGMFATLIVAMLSTGALNVMIERVAYRPLRGAPKLAPLITAIGMSFILQNIGLLWRPTPDDSPDLIGSQRTIVDIFGVDVLRSDVFSIA